MSIQNMHIAHLIKLIVVPGVPVPHVRQVVPARRHAQAPHPLLPRGQEDPRDRRQEGRGTQGQAKLQDQPE